MKNFKEKLIENFRDVDNSFEKEIIIFKLYLKKNVI